MRGQLRFKHATVAMLATSAAAAASSSSSSGREISGPSAIRANYTAWNAALESPDATFSTPIPGYDITQTYPARSVDGWKLSIGLTPDVPTTVDEPTGDGGSFDFFTGTRIQWKAPESLIHDGGVDQDSSWKLCAGFFSGPRLTSDDQEVDPSCKGFLSDKCIEAMNSVLHESGCHDVTPTPDECIDTFVNYRLFPVEFNTNISAFDFYLGFESHPKGNTSEYRETLSDVWITSFRFDTSASGGDSSDDAPSPGDLTCLRAKDFANGSLIFEGGATQATRSSYWVVLTAAVMAVFAAAL